MADPDPILPRMRIPSRVILADEVYEAIKARLMDREVAAGERLNIEALSRDLGVSPTPVREALARLEAEGLVSKTPLVGYVASAPLDAQSCANLFAVRLLLEPEAARLAALNSGAAQVSAIRGALGPEQRLPAGENHATYRGVVISDAAFHAAIGDASENPMLRDSIVRLHAHIHVYRAYFRTGVEATIRAEHVKIMDAIARGDGLGAKAAMRGHLVSSRDRLMTSFEDAGSATCRQSRRPGGAARARLQP
jgi:DNA-binding GntR family transcriptional regulator